VSFGLSSLSLLPNSCAGLKQKNEDASRPNFILFITDDISFNDLGCYGNEKIKTPNLDKMAAEGVVFDNAYLTVSSCSPSRCSMITGRYPHNTGAPELHTELPMDQFTFPQALREAGYYTALSGKNHMGDVKRAFNKISKGGRPSGSRNWLGILEERPKDKPFFFWFASRDSHRGWQLNELAPTYGPKDVTVPPFLYDGPVTREDLASYYHEVSRTDTYAGKLRAELERQGIADNTYIIYCSDNGRPFPRCKTRLYDSGIKTPLIIWGPKHLRGTRTDSLVSSIDFSATILELAGLKKHPAIQGVSFAAILKDSKATTRDYIFAEHNWHVYQAHERMVRYEKWLYIRNAWPQRQNLCVESASDFPAGEELWDAEAKGRLKAHQRDVFLKPRAAEELYDTSKDPYQFTNLVELKEHRGVLRHLRKAMDQWIEQTGDTIPADPTKDRKYTRGLKPRPARKRGTLPGAKRNATAINHPGPIRKKDVL
jgi:arylsulfatase